MPESALEALLLELASDELISDEVQPGKDENIKEIIRTIKNPFPFLMTYTSLSESSN
jgi:hypothetical protein